MGRRTTVPVRNAAQEHQRRPGRSRLAAAAALLVCMGAPALTEGRAGATSAATLRQQAQQILAQINANGERISTLDDEINGAQYRLSQLQSEIHRTALQVASAQRTIDALHSAVVSRAAALYQGSGTVDVAAQSAASVQQQGAMTVYSQAAAAQDQQRIDAYRNARDARTRAKGLLDAAQARQRQELASLQAEQRQIVSLNRHEQTLYSHTNAALKAEIQSEQLKALEAQRAASERAARAAAARAQQSSGPGVVVGPAPAPNPGAAAAVRYAMAQIGKPYAYGAAGPGAFDCSGLTMMAWAQAGVSMPHFADAQYREFPHVPIADAQPGDLAFFGTPSYVHHVGIIIGNGLMVEAPYTTADVREAGYMRRDLVAIGRP